MQLERLFVPLQSAADFALSPSRSLEIRSRAGSPTEFTKTKCRVDGPHRDTRPHSMARDMRGGRKCERGSGKLLASILPARFVRAHVAQRATSANCQLVASINLRLLPCAPNVRALRSAVHEQARGGAHSAV